MFPGVHTQTGKLVFSAGNKKVNFSIYYFLCFRYYNCTRLIALHYPSILSAYVGSRTERLLLLLFTTVIAVYIRTQPQAAEPVMQVGLIQASDRISLLSGQQQTITALYIFLTSYHHAFKLVILLQRLRALPPNVHQVSAPGPRWGTLSPPISTLLPPV